MPTQNQLLSFAKDMRNNPTKAEQQLWRLLKNEKDKIGKFRRQHPFGQKYIADFISLDHKLVIEVDGDGHDGKKDSARDTFMQKEGYQILRFSGDDVLSRPVYVIETIVHAINYTPSVALRAPPPPSRGRKG